MLTCPAGLDKPKRRRCGAPGHETFVAEDGRDIVGRLPGAFRHPTEGAVDAPVM